MRLGHYAVGGTLAWALLLCAGQLFAEKLAVYHTSDIHGYYFLRTGKDGLPHGGFAVLENVLQKEKEPFVLLDSGDFSSGNKEANASDGRYSIELMNNTGKTPKNILGQGYAALTIGNHDKSSVDYTGETYSDVLGPRWYSFNRGDVHFVAMDNIIFSGEDYTIFPGDRIAQIIPAPAVRLPFVKADALSPTARGEGGFGSTGRC